MEEEQLFDRSAQKGAQVLEALQNQLMSHPNVGDVRGKGLLIGIELVKDKTTKEPLNIEAVNKVIATCKESGVIIGKNGTTVAGFNNVLILSPPLNISDDDIKIVLDTLAEAIHQLNV